MADHEAAGPGDGRFTKLMNEVPGLRLGLDQMLLDRLKDKAWAQVPSPARYHALFKSLLAKAGVPLGAYPYNTVSLAYESVRRDLHSRWKVFCQARKARRQAFTRPPPTGEVQWVYDRIEIDEQLVDCETSTVDIQLSLGEQLPPLRLPRFTVLTAVDVSTDCIVGFRIALTAHPRQNDLLALLYQCVSRWPERDVQTSGMKLWPGAGFPSTDPQLPLPLPREIALDNAWMHHAHSVESFVTQELGATISYGRPQCPTVRQTIETCFNRLNQHLSHRLASTTGSSVTDPKRESKKNRKAIPIMSLPDFENALYVTFAESNRQTRARLASASPLAALRHQVEQTYVIEVDDDRRACWNPFKVTKQVKVHDLTKPERKPYINFEYLRYKGPGLLALPNSDSKVFIRYDRRDIRRVEAVTAGGQSLGELHCPGSWQSYPHSVETRRYLHKTHGVLIGQSRDPLTDYFDRLRAQLSNPTDVANFLRTYEEFVGGFGLPNSLWSPAPEPETDQSSKTGDRKLVPPQRQKSAPANIGRRFWSLNLNPGVK
ncbi:hypothetical protein MYE70_00590 [Marinobacter alexandrii]|uniref:hypothetical protein n=1 Tax=Marinobacter alexandrii TaxID=2570351 RepID=UPI001FFFF846|nr:hypothetical protein [Marinobacter alexandrii]MCK2147554.1 hypothetical protein [Marinobacter alexandrii]